MTFGLGSINAVLQLDDVPVGNWVGHRGYLSERGGGDERDQGPEEQKAAFEELHLADWNFWPDCSFCRIGACQEWEVREDLYIITASPF